MSKSVVTVEVDTQYPPPIMIQCGIQSLLDSIMEKYGISEDGAALIGANAEVYKRIQELSNFVGLAVAVGQSTDEDDENDD